MGIGIQRVGENDRVMSGPFAAVKKHCSIIADIIPGEKSKSEAAKSYLKWVQKKLPNGVSISLDEIVAALPTGLMSVHVAAP